MKHQAHARLVRLAIAVALAGSAAAEHNVNSPALVRTAPGWLYMTDRGRIMQVDTQKQRLRPVTSDISARGLLLDGENNIYAPSMRYDPRSDLYRPTMWRYSPGEPVTETRAAPAAERFTFSDVVDSEGNLYFWHVDPKRGLSRILVRPKGGETILLAGHDWGIADGRGADARFSRLGGMAVGPNGNLFVCDEQCVRRVDQKGNVTTLARGGLLSLGAGRTEDNHLGAIAVDESGGIYVADRATRRIIRVSPDGEVSTLAHAAENWKLASLAWSDGALYVLECGPDGSNRVLRVTPDGHRQELPRAEAPADDSPKPAPLRLSDHGGLDDMRGPFLPMFFMPVTRLP